MRTQENTTKSAEVMPPPLAANAFVDCGWGRLIFGHTFDSNDRLARTLQDEAQGRRDIAMYLTDPHVVLALAPQDLFLDPSHTYRVDLPPWKRERDTTVGFAVRPIRSWADGIAINRVAEKRHMVSVAPEFIWSHRGCRELTYLVAEDLASGEIIGSVLGVDHVAVFGDPENGCSLWSLAVDPQSMVPGVGQALVTQLLAHFANRGRSYLDLSVLHDNDEAIALYEKLGFRRVPVFCVKRKNPFNEPLFIAPPPEEKLNPYAEIIVREARRRGIHVDVLNEGDGWFELTLGGRTVVCRESLSELTTAVAMSRCHDKRITRRVLSRAGLRTPAQVEASSRAANEEFLAAHRRVVVKPTFGEQGAGISVDVRTPDELHAAIERARQHADVVLLEEMVEGDDLRIIVINDRVVAAAVRRPPEVTGTGEHSVRTLIEKQSRRRAAATGGESRIPIDDETERCVRSFGYELDSILPRNTRILVRKTANLHTGGTIHDVTEQLHPELAEAAERAAVALRIPVVGFDFIVPDVQAPDYAIIEANERPGLANHEPQPTAERFIDLLFPYTASTETWREARRDATRRR